MIHQTSSPPLKGRFTATLCFLPRYCYFPIIILLNHHHHQPHHHHHHIATIILPPSPSPSTSPSPYHIAITTITITMVILFNHHHHQQSSFYHCHQYHRHCYKCGLVITKPHFIKVIVINIWYGIDPSVDNVLEKWKFWVEPLVGSVKPLLLWGVQPLVQWNQFCGDGREMKGFCSGGIWNKNGGIWNRWFCDKATVVFETTAEVFEMVLFPVSVLSIVP